MSNLRDLPIDEIPEYTITRKPDWSTLKIDLNLSMLKCNNNYIIKPPKIPAQELKKLKTS